jgi:hypothetical protein
MHTNLFDTRHLRYPTLMSINAVNHYYFYVMLY